MDSNVEITSLNLEEITSGGNDSKDSAAGNNTTPVSVALGTNDEKNLIRGRDCKTRMKRHTEKENEISIGDQARRETNGPPEGFPPLRNARESSSPVKEQKERERERHLPEESGNESFTTSVIETPRSPLKFQLFQNGPTKLSPSVKLYSEMNKENQPFSSAFAIEELRKQNRHLMEVLMKTQKSQLTEKKRFNDILLGIDKALSSLPIRLEKIRVRNQRNLSIINSSRFYSGDGNENPNEMSGCESSPSDDSLLATSQGSEGYLSSRMKSLLQKMDQLNDLIHTINEGDTSPIEVLVNSELYAISLLKKEIKTTKKQIEGNKTDTETVTSFEGNHKELTEDSSSKAKNSFSNELDKASNFKIFENHMILQEEALNLLTRKIKETEEALLKEVEAKEGLKRENEALAKEVFRLKSSAAVVAAEGEEEESRGEKLLKTEKLKQKTEATGNRPYRLIKELKTKLEEKEKCLIAWKSKCSRSEAAGANKTLLLEAERKKNFELDTVVTNLRAQNKSMSAHLTSLQFINEQLREQIEILKHQVEILANDKLEKEIESSRNTVEQISEIGENVKAQEVKVKRIEKEAESRLQELRIYYERELSELEFQLKKHKDKNDMFAETFKELLITISDFGVGRDLKNIRSPSYDRIRAILHITPSDLELLFGVYAKSSAEKEVERLYAEFQSIVNGEEVEFSGTLSTWFFEIIMEKLLQWGSGEKNNALDEG